LEYSLPSRMRLKLLRFHGSVGSSIVCMVCILLFYLLICTVKVTFLNVILRIHKLIQRHGYILVLGYCDSFQDTCLQMATVSSSKMTEVFFQIGDSNTALTTLMLQLKNIKLSHKETCRH
jgi:hypothetical protein